MKRQAFNGLFAGAATVALFTGCALNNVTVPIAYKPSADLPMSKVPPSRIEIRVTDQRPSSEAAAIGNKRNGFNSITAKVLPSRPPTEMVATALRQEFQAAGRSVGDANAGAEASVSVELKRFFSDLHFGVWQATQTAWIEAAVTVRKPVTPGGGSGEGEVFEVNAISEIKNPVVTTGDFIEVLEGALKNFVRQVVSNPKLLERLGSKP